MKSVTVLGFTLLVLGMVGSAFAQVQYGNGDMVEVQYTGVNTHGTVHIYRDGGYFGHYYAAELGLSVDGVATFGYCVDLDHTIHAGQSWDAELWLTPKESPWCEASYILSNYEAVDNATGSAIQVAMWKLVYGEGNLYVSEASVEAAADALLAEAAGQCYLGCDGTVAFEYTALAGVEGGLVETTLTATQDGTLIAGQPVTVTVSVGALVEPAGGVGITDASGELVVQVDMTGESLPLTVTAETDGQDFFVLDPVQGVQQALSTFWGQGCSYDDAGTFDDEPLGDVRTIGFWKHQLKVWDTGRGNAHVEAGELEAFLPIDVFGTTYDSLQALYDGLWIDNKNATMGDRAQQQCLATRLNLANGALGWFTPIDGDYFWVQWSDAGGAYDGGDFEYAKDICDGINNL